MTGTFLSGVLSAWAAAQLGLGAFFVLAYLAGRRETEYLVFGLLCFSLSVMSMGIAIDYHGGRHANTASLCDDIGAKHLRPSVIQLAGRAVKRDSPRK